MIEMLLQFAQSPTGEAISLALLHFLWQGTCLGSSPPSFFLPWGAPLRGDAIPSLADCCF